MLSALQREFDVVSVVRQPWAPWAALTRRVIRRLSGGSIDLYWWPAWTAIAATRALAQVTGSGADVAFAVAVTPISTELSKQMPTVFVSDATQASMVDYNPRHKALAPWLKRSAASLESASIQNALFSLFPSDWAGRSAVRDHGGWPERIAQIPWGANLIADEVIAPESRSPVHWRLLFVGTNWHGKGGDIALETLALLRQRGYSVHLDIVGSRPKTVPSIEGVTFHGFLDKNIPQDADRMRALFASAHLFFLPTRFDALGIVFAEAASFAIPSVSYRTGGVPSMVIDGETGVLLEEGASAEAFAGVLAELLSDTERYVRMSHAAKAASRDIYNWTAWAHKVRLELEARMNLRSCGRKPPRGGPECSVES